MDQIEVDLTGRLMADMDPRLLELLLTRVNSFVKWDLVRFFYDNPQATDTSENIARYAGRSAQAISGELEELARDGVLEERALGELLVYSLTADEEVKELLGEFVKASDDRQFRAKAIYHIIRGTRPQAD